MLTGFAQECQRYQSLSLTAAKEAVEEALQKERLTPHDFAALLSPAAEAYLEAMAQKAHRLTVQHFGRTILLYTPLYLSDYCSNRCLYCGFSSQQRIPRHHLQLAQVEAEGKAIAASGLRHILLLTGDAPKLASLDYLSDCLKALRPHFASLALEIYALDKEGYQRLAAAGADQMTMYQETYDPVRYAEVHPAGPKRDYHFRLAAPEAACQAGLRGVNLGALLGLSADWRRDAFFTALHAHYLLQRYPEVDISLSFPRLRPHGGSFRAAADVSDRNLVQFILASRLFLPRSGMTLSTRESADLRNHLLPLGITKMSAGVSTAVGGHTGTGENGQFEIADRRSVAEMCRSLREHGYQPVMKDWQPL